MKRLPIFPLSIALAFVVCGALMTRRSEVGSGGIGSVSLGLSEAIVEGAATLILVLAVLAGRALLIRFRKSHTAPKS